MLRIADKLQKLGKKYYKQGDTSKTAVFWELEQVFKDIAEEIESVKKCLFTTCSKADAPCGHDEYTVVCEKLSLEQAKKKYPKAKFCEDWVGEEGEPKK